MRNILSHIGAAMAVLGVLSIVMNVLNREILLMSWTSNWGDVAGWIIRVAFVIVGFILYRLDKTGGKGAAQ